MKVLICIATILFSFSVLQLPAQEDEPETKTETKTQDAKPKTKVVKPKPIVGAAVYDVFEEPWRSKFITAWTQEVENTKGRLKSAARQRNTKELRRQKETLKKLERNDDPYLSGGGCDRNSANWEIGNYGMNGETPNVHQVVDEHHLLVCADNEPNAPIYMLQMESTEGIVDGKAINLRGKFLHVSGTKNYTTVLGASKSVLLVEVIDVDSLKTKPTE